MHVAFSMPAKTIFPQNISPVCGHHCLKIETFILTSLNSSLAHNNPPAELNGSVFKASPNRPPFIEICRAETTQGLSGTSFV